MNNTHRSIDMIPKDMMICDWHYERPDKTAVYFAMKGFQVVTCPWRNPGVAIVQLNDMVNYRQTATAMMKENYQGLIQTVWLDPVSFMDEFYGKKKDAAQGDNTAANCFKTLFDGIQKLNTGKVK